MLLWDETNINKAQILQNGYLWWDYAVFVSEYECKQSCWCTAHAQTGTLPAAVVEAVIIMIMIWLDSLCDTVIALIHSDKQ